MKTAMNYTLTTIGLVISFLSLQAQNEDYYKSEITLGHDNDFLIAYTGTDRYYTYGLNGSFKWRSDQGSFFLKNNPNYKSHYTQIKANIEAYTPEYLSEGRVDPNEERPYAGWSYVNLSQNTAFTKSFTRFGVDIGILGPDSKAGEIQNWFHRQFTSDPELDGWDERQLDNQFGFNIRGLYGQDLWTSGLFNIYTTADVSIGNIYNHGRANMHFRFGNFAPIQYSVAHQNQLLAPKSQKEFFVDIGLGAKLAAFNATVQGDLFDNDDPFTVDEINSLIFNGYFGLCFMSKGFSTTLKYNLTTGTLDSSEVNRYASLILAQRF
ncbi:lipid A-modifier LpxR family protein [Croceiramulus getboli]|nr:DUF2219 family protein [Flavobacteriaceae bacterium YJPT1-3]